MASEPLGPFHQYGTNEEVWIAETVLNLSVQHNHDWVGGKELTKAREEGFTVIQTASLGCFAVKEPIDEVRQRLGWVSDLEKTA